MVTLIQLIYSIIYMAEKTIYKVPVAYPNTTFERVVVAESKEEAIKIVKKEETRNLYNYTNPEKEVTEMTYYGSLND